MLAETPTSTASARFVASRAIAGPDADDIGKTNADSARANITWQSFDRVSLNISGAGVNWPRALRNN